MSIFFIINQKCYNILDRTIEKSGLKEKSAELGKGVICFSPLALAWILKDDVITSVIAGASRPSQILANIHALENTTFTEEELRAINEAAGEAADQGL